MTDTYKQKNDLVAELEAARRRIAELESEQARRHRAESVLRKNAEFLRGILDTSAAGIFVADREGTIVFANPRIEELSGMPVEVFLGRSCLVVHWELRDVTGQRLKPENDPYFRARDQGERTFDLLALYQRPDGAVRHLNANVAPLREADGTISHVVFAMNDVTARVQAEEAYRVLVEDSLQGFCLVQNDEVVYANSALARMFDCGVDELVGLNFADGVEMFVHPADQCKFIETFEGLASGRLPRHRFEWRLQRRDNGTRYVETYLSIVLYKGRPAIQFIDLDITERREAEQALRESEERYRLLADNAVDMISRHAPDGTVLYVTPSCEALSGYTADELLGKPAEFLIHPDDAEKAWKAVNSAREKGGRYVVEHRLPRKNGTVIWVENSGRFVRDTSGTLTEIQCAVRDITDRKRAEQALREKKQHLRTLLQSAPVIMFASDLNGICTFFEGRGLEHIGVDPEQFIGTSMPEYYADKPTMKAWLERALAGEEFSVEYFHKPSGRTLMGHSAQLYDAQGNREGVVVVSFDITEQKKAENAYQALVEQSLQGLALVRSGRIIFVNPRASVITGYSREELLGFSSDGVFDLVFPADHAMVLDRMQRRQCGEDLPPLFHLRIRRKDGAIRRLLMSTSPIEFENTPVVQVAFIDMTDFPQARYEER